MKTLLVITGLSLLLSGCPGIWNAGDLEIWVRNEAVESGCAPDSVVLDEWYTSENGQNIWQGTCIDMKSGDKRRVQAGVDGVWKPSG